MSMRTVLTLPVNLEDLREHCAIGIAVSTPPKLTADGNSAWSLDVYPQGTADSPSDQGYIAVYVRCNMLASHLGAVRVLLNIRVVNMNGLVFGVQVCQSDFMHPVAPNAWSKSAQYGFPSFAKLQDLPSSSFVVEADVVVLEAIRKDALVVLIPSISDICAKLPHPKSSPGFMHVDPVLGAKWVLDVFPNGDSLAEEGKLSVILKLLALPSGVLHVCVVLTVRIMSVDGILLERRVVQSGPMAPEHMSSCPVRFDCRSVEDLVPEAGWGGVLVAADLCFRTIEGSITAPLVSTVVGECPADAHVSAPRNGRESESTTASPAAAVSAFGGGGSGGSRVAEGSSLEEQVRRLDLRALEHTHGLTSRLLADKRMSEVECPICMERGKDVAIVPCGHRYCSTCIERLDACPECRTLVAHRLRLV